MLELGYLVFSCAHCMRICQLLSVRKLVMESTRLFNRTNHVSQAISLSCQSLLSFGFCLTTLFVLREKVILTRTFFLQLALRLNNGSRLVLHKLMSSLFDTLLDQINLI